MDRKAIHEQISSIIDKLSFLNERLSEEKKLHPVEVDLLNGYARELQGMIENLGKTKSELTVVEREETAPPPVVEEVKPVIEKKLQPAVEKQPEPVVERKQEPVAEKKIDSELKLHQHILEKAETAKIPDDPEAFLEEEKKPAPRVKISTEEIPVRKKSVKTQDAESVSLNERFKKEVPAVGDKLKSKKKKSLQDSFDLNERFAFIENLFGGSAEQFKRAVQDLGKCASRTEAEQYIKNVESKFAWNNKPELAKRFSGQVFELIG